MSVKVQQFTSNKGNPVINHFIIHDSETGIRYFQSYDSIIVKINRGRVTLGRDWKYSPTTSKYRAMFLGETTAETQRKLDSGEYLYDENL